MYIVAQHSVMNLFPSLLYKLFVTVVIRVSSQLALRVLRSAHLRPSRSSSRRSFLPPGHPTPQGRHVRGDRTLTPLLHSVPPLPLEFRGHSRVSIRVSPAVGGYSDISGGVPCFGDGGSEECFYGGIAGCICFCQGRNRSGAGFVPLPRRRAVLLRSRRWRNGFLDTCRGG